MEDNKYNSIGKFKSHLWHSHFVNSMIFPLVYPDKIKYNSLLPWISLFMGTDRYNIYKTCKICGFSEWGKENCQKFCVFLQSLFQSEKYQNFVNLSYQNHISKDREKKKKKNGKKMERKEKKLMVWRIPSYPPSHLQHQEYISDLTSRK